MANRYWVGGNGTWNSTNTTNWSETSGGAGGASVPSSTDAVIFDDASFATNLLVVTISGSVSCSTLSNQRSGTKILKLAGSNTDNLNIYGSFLTTGTTGNYDGSAALFYVVVQTNSTSDSDSAILTGATPVSYIRLPNTKRARISFTADSGTIQQVNIGENCYLRFLNSLRVGRIIQDKSSPSTLVTSQVHVGTFSSTSTTVLKVDSAGVCLSGSLLFTSNGTVPYLLLTGLGGDQTINLQFGAISRLTINPDVPFRYFTISGTMTSSIIERATGSLAFTFRVSPSGTNLSCTQFNISGDISTQINIESSVPGVRAKITKTGGGTVETNYVQVKDMQPYPDNTWISYNSINAGNNYQWYFNTFTKPTSCLFFGGDA